MKGATPCGPSACVTMSATARNDQGFGIWRAASDRIWRSISKVDRSLALIPIVLVIMGLAYSLSAYPVGVLSDRVNRLTLLAIGLLLLIVADLVLAFATGIVAVGIGVVFWGLHMGFTQGLLATLIADAAPAELRGTAFGVFNLMTGVALLVASLVAGALWDMTGPQGTFLAGAAFALLTLAGLLVIRGRLGRWADA